MKLKHEAIEFLREILADDSVPVTDIAALASLRGIRWRTLRRASDELCLVKRPSAESTKWHWSLPSKASKLSNGGSNPQLLTNSTKAEKPKGTPEMWRAFVASQNFTFSTCQWPLILTHFWPTKLTHPL